MRRVGARGIVLELDTAAKEEIICLVPSPGNKPTEH
jgi:hypothetical protein